MRAVLICLSVCFGVSFGFEDKTVFQYLVDNGYTSFTRLLRESNLDTSLNSAGPFTIFAPTDSAIANTDPNLMVSLGHNPGQLKGVLQYHIANGFSPVPMLLSVANVKTIEGQEITVSKNGSSTVLNGMSTVIAGDIICNNGIIHFIDTMLLPPVFGTHNIAQVIVTQDYRFKEFFNFLLLTNLTTFLEGGEYTLFAPVDAAWSKYLDRILHPHVKNIAHLYIEMLKYHMIPGSRTLSAMSNGQRLYTLHGYPVNITMDGGVTMVNQAHIIDADIPASNGVVHALDDVLFPRDLMEEIIREVQQAHQQG